VADAKKAVDPQKEIEILVAELEEKVDRLRAMYEQYFMGYEKLEPSVPRRDVDRRFTVLRKANIRNTALRFRFNVVTQKFNTYSMYWTRICRQIEEGTFKRHVARANRKFGPGGRRGNADELSIDVDLADFDIDIDDFDEEDMAAEAERAAATDRPGAPTTPPQDLDKTDRPPPPSRRMPDRVNLGELDGLGLDGDTLPPGSIRPAPAQPRIARPAALPAGMKQRVLLKKNDGTSGPSSTPTPTPQSAPVRGRMPSFTDEGSGPASRPPPSARPQIRRIQSDPPPPSARPQMPTDAYARPRMTTQPSARPQLPTDAHARPRMTTEPQARPQLPGDAARPRMTTEPHARPRMTIEPSARPRMTTEPSARPQLPTDGPPSVRPQVRPRLPSATDEAPPPSARTQQAPSTSVIRAASPAGGHVHRSPAGVVRPPAAGVVRPPISPSAQSVNRVPVAKPSEPGSVARQPAAPTRQPSTPPAGGPNPALGKQPGAPPPQQRPIAAPSDRKMPVGLPSGQPSERKLPAPPASESERGPVSRRPPPMLPSQVKKP
jgi:hypothetical protein